MNDILNRRGLLVVVSAPSGGGKTTVLQNVLARENAEFRYAISATTRPRRPNELNGSDYYFLSPEEFLQKRKNEQFVEWAEVHGYLYGTLKEPLEKWLSEGKVVFLDLDVKGGLSIKEQFPGDSVLIFIKPPSFESLLHRLKNRNTENDVEINKRLERYPREMELSEKYDYVIVNDDLTKTVDEIFEILNTRHQVC